MTTKNTPTKEKKVEGWQDAFRLRQDLLQPDVYAFEKAIQKLGGFTLSIIGGGTVQATHVLQAAIEAGWIAEPETEVGEFGPSSNGSGPADKEKRYFIGGKGLHEMTAGEVIWYGSKVTEAYKDAVDIPPN